MDLSLIIPIYNEKESLKILLEQITNVLGRKSYEIILVNDGSTDGSEEIIKRLAIANRRVRGVNLSRNYGQTAALAAGLDQATGKIIVTMDGDLENDPKDIPKFLDKISQGSDVVSGWRINRWQDKLLTRKLPSMAANFIIRKVTSTNLHDYGCSFKAYRHEILADIKLYGDMHRYLPIYAYWNGAKIAEIPITNRKRLYGESHYNLARTGSVLLDLVALKFLSGYLGRPLHFFGAVGFVSMFFGILAGLLATYYKLSKTDHKDFIQTPLPVIMAMLVVVGVMLVMMGLLAEILIRVYHESSGRRIYTVKNK